MEDNKITLTTPDNKTIEVEVLDIFNVVGYEGKDYIMYTLGEKIDEENEKVYISILNDKGDNNFELVGITDDKEWDMVEKAIQEEITYGDDMKDE
ncbi:MAG: DUF1292 domain-containing protein [bacterium]|nr:DUF1292 domain-containing protein [Mycoplasmatota bacterium]MDD6757038.1 DUF1292 domain-containing protein [bacterium]MDY2907879.1 DUF1292 domain-containing protein [Candidatus Faecimonas sp.]